MSSPDSLPVGKLPVSLLKELIQSLPKPGAEVLLGPGIGLDCAVVQPTGKLLVFKSDPITFASDLIGWYAVHVNTNDLVTTGAVPRWMLVTILLPEQEASWLAKKIMSEIIQTCAELEITIVGGHTEITHNLDRPIVVGTIIGEVDHDNLLSPQRVISGDRLLLTKGVPIEATAILGREFSDRLVKAPQFLKQDELAEAQRYLTDPGISVRTEAEIAALLPGVRAMHDPTEGGVVTALWELADACGHDISVDPSKIPVYPLAKRICAALNLDPLSAIASGSLLIVVAPENSGEICQVLQKAGIVCTEIGWVMEPSDHPFVKDLSQPDFRLLPRPERDEITKLYDPKIEREKSCIS